MRLTVVVESLAEENAHGVYREEALKVFKERKFAMPVQLDDTFETVWSDIEHRYKTNYLDARQAATFSIKKLQDAYDCDLDMTDTVGAIFEGEPDRKMHVIKVIPHFAYRETSVVPGSMLRPSGAQKRLGDDMDEGAPKRRRVASQQPQTTQEPREPSPNRPLPSTESQQAAAAGADRLEADTRSARCTSAASLVELRRLETGQAPFSATAVKQESPEPTEPEPPAANGTDAASPPIAPAGRASPATHAPAQQQQQPSPTRPTPPHEEPQEAPPLDSQEAAIHKSPVSSAEAEPAPAPAPAPAPVAKKRRDVYQVPSSPEFMHKKATPDKTAKTYGRSPRSAHVIQREVDLLNMARRLPRGGQGKQTAPNGIPVPLSKKARAFQRPEPDEIESTPQEDAGPDPREERHVTSDEDSEDADLTASFLDEAVESRPNGTQTPARKTLAKPVKPGSLKKPSRAAMVATPASARRGAQPKVSSTPASRASANTSGAANKTGAASKTGTKGNPPTPATAESATGKKALSQETLLRMERMQELFSGSPNLSKRKGDIASPVWSGSTEFRARSNKSSPEIRIPAAKKASPMVSSSETVSARLAVQPPKPQQTPVKRSVLLPPSIKKSASIDSTATRGAAETPKVGGTSVPKKPAAAVRESPAPLPSAKQTSIATATGTPRRSEVPLPANVRNLRQRSSLQSPPLANGHPDSAKGSPPTPVKTSTKGKKAMSNTDVESSEAPVVAPTSNAKPATGAIVISSAEVSTTESSDSEDVHQRYPLKSGMNGTVDGANASNHDENSTQLGETTTQQTQSKADIAIGDEIKQSEETNKLKSPHNTQEILPQTQDKPPSGQGASQAAPWGVESWGFSSLGHTDDRSDKEELAQQPGLQAIAPAASTSEDEGFVEQEMYSTAIEDNASRSRSASMVDSIRSSPAVSRRPARFLSHSPTPDASESEDESDEAPLALPRVAPQLNDKDDSESESSSDSSEDEDVQMSDVPAQSTTNPNANAAPPSSPPVNAASDSTPVVPETSQVTLPQVKHRLQRTPVPLPAQQSSQAPRSSQSISVQAADRRRYAGFRSLREQLADTKAAQSATQKKTFDPRTMSLGKLAKGKPLVGFSSNSDESSNDDSSSSSSSE